MTGQDYTAWIGRQEIAPPDQISPRLIDSYVTTLAPFLAEAPVAPGLHWCLCPPITPMSGLGADGHAAKGGFLPPIPLPRRMWAGGEVTFLEPLLPDDPVQKTSTIREILWKTGRTGALCFVAVEHDYRTPRGVAIREIQNLVYRPAATASAPVAAPSAVQHFDREWQVPIDPVLLFRYSAVTFNGHRIHYDQGYARQVEHYAGLVIHGPLQATLMLNLATVHRQALPRRFRYRGINPAAGSQVLRIGLQEDDAQMQLAVLSEAGVLTMQGEAVW